MKRILYFAFLCLIVHSLSVSAETVEIYATRYKLRIYNYAENSGAKYDPTSQTAVPIGMYSRPGGYDSEILCDFDLSSIPAEVIINSVDFGYNVSSVGAGTHPFKAYENTRAWSGTPTYNTFGNTAWPSSDLLVSETATGTGWHDFTSNANMKSLVEGWLASPSSNRGIILTDVPNYYGWEMQVTRVRLVVDYTPSVTEYDLSLTIGSDGSVEVSAPGFPATTYSSDVVLPFEEGTNVTLTALPDAPQFDIQWSGDATGTNATVAVLMDGDKSVIASFVENLRYLDSLALVVFYNATNGPNWRDNTNWLTNEPIDMWFGITVFSNRVERIFLVSNGVEGAVPVILGNLTALKNLTLVGNTFSGPIPIELANLNNLEVLNLYENYLTGSIPVEITTLTSLDSLLLGGSNHLSGTIPPEIGNMISLLGLSLGGNNFTGGVPPEIGNLINLRWFGIHSGIDNGTIPPEFGNLSGLEFLDIANNNILTLPEEISNLTNLTYCNLRYNQFCTFSPTVEAWADTYAPDWAAHQTCPPPEIQVTAVPQIGPAPLTVDFTATNTGQSNIDTWAWNFGDGGTSTDRNPTYIYAAAGTFTAQVTATGIGGSTTESVTIDAFGPPVVSITASPQSGEAPLTVTFTGDNTGGPVDTWAWDFGDGTSSNVQNPPDHIYNTVGIYTAILTATNGAGTATDQVTIDATPPIVTLTMSVTGQGTTSPSMGDTTVFQDVDVPIDAIAGSSYEFVEWSITAGTATITDPYQPSTTVRLSTNATINAYFEEVLDPRKIDSLALVALYNGMDGLNWTNNTNWLTLQPLDTWYGITILNDRVSEIKLNSNQLAGDIPLEIVNLTNVKAINFVNNQLTGPILSELGSLINLQILELRSNQLTGPIPSELGSLINLQILNLAMNQLTGPIPAELVSLTNLQNLILGVNQLSGPILSEFGNLSNLKNLNLGGNQLNGQIPVELGNLNNLENLQININNLTGSIPSELGNLANLKSLYLDGNQLTGSIPSELGNLVNLKTIYFIDNQLTGSIPPEFGNLTNLETLILDVNNLTGPFPLEIGSLINLTYLSVSYNNLTGPLPSEFGNLNQLQHFNINYNQFTDLPEEIVNLNQINYCNLGTNQFCTLSPAVEAWADQNDPDWASSQNCPPPEIQVTATPQSGPIPLTVNFTATNIGQSNIDTWYWNFGDGGSSNQQNPTHIFTTANSYTVQVTASGIGGSTTEQVVINAIGPPVVNANAVPQSGEAPLSVTFTATVTSGPVDTWDWDFGDGASSTAQNPPPHTYATAGTYTAILTATNVAGAGTDQVTINVVTATATLTMTVVGQGTTTPSLGDTTVEENVAVPISAIPAAGYDFIDWLVVAGGAVIADPSQSATTVTLSDNATIQAHFALKEYTLTVTAGQNGSTNPTGAVVATHGIPVPVVALPDVGYNFALWSVVNGNAAIANPTAESTDVVLDNGDAEIFATFVTDTNYTPYSQMLSITGTLYDEYGNPVGYPDPVDVDASIRLVTEETVGDTVYTETFYGGNGQAVEVDNGLFVARLGAGTTVDNLQAVLAAYENLFVEITVENGTPDVLLPRTPLTSGAYTLTGPPTNILQLNTINGSGDPNALNVPGRVGMYYIDDETGATYLKLNTGWKLMD